MIRYIIAGMLCVLYSELAFSQSESSGFNDSTNGKQLEEVVLFHHACLQTGNQAFIFIRQFSGKSKCCEYDKTGNLCLGTLYQRYGF